MARLVFDDNYTVLWMDTPPADAASITQAEVTAATDVTKWITKDGFAPGVTNSRVAAGDLSTTFDAELMGTHGAQLSVTAYLDDVDASNVAYDTFGVRGTTGAFVVAWTGSTAAAAPAFVWPYVEAGSPSLPTTAANERQTFTQEFAVGGNGTEPNYHAVFAV